MKRSVDYKPAMNHAILNLGYPGTGKSTLAIKFPKPYILDCDQNLDGPIQHWIRAGDPADFKFDCPLYDKDGNLLAPEKRYARANELLKEAAADPEVETIIIDSFTAFVDMALAEVRRQMKRKLADGVTVFIDENLQIQDWGAFKFLMKNVIVQLRTTGKLTIVNGHVRTDTNEIDKIVRYYLNCPGSTAEEIASYFTEVWVNEIIVTPTAGGVKKEYTIRTYPAIDREAPLGLKSGFGLPNRMTADYKKILELMKGKTAPPIPELVKPPQKAA